MFNLFEVYDRKIKYGILDLIMEWPKIIYYAVLVIALAGSFLGYRDRRYVLFIPLIALSLAIEIIREFVDRGSPLDTATLLFMVIVEYSLLSLIISNFIQSRIKRKVTISSVFVMIPLFIILQVTLISKNSSYHYLNQMIAAPLLCVWTISYLFEAAKHDEEFEITKSPMFWICLGNLLFYSGSFFSYGFGGYLSSKGSKDTANTIFWIARILNILLYILYFIGFLCLRKRKSYLLRS